jgi:putative sterol carrier protein
MVKNARDFFSTERSRKYDSRLEGVTGTYRFDIEGGDHWHATVTNGRVDICQSTADADCVIGCSEEDFIKIANGEQNLLTATLQGRVVVSGNLALAQKFHALVRSRPQDADTENTNER